MAKRKASTPAEEMMNGDDVDARRQSRSSLRMDGSSTPKRSMGNNVPQKSLSFGSPVKMKQALRFMNLDRQVSEKMVKLNQAFLAQIAKCTVETPDAIMFPVLESYFRHVHNVLTPHLPKYLTQLDDKQGFRDVANFLDKFKRALGKDDEEEDPISNNNNKPKNTLPKSPQDQKSSDPVTPERKLAIFVAPEKVAVSVTPERKLTAFVAPEREVAVSVAPERKLAVTAPREEKSATASVFANFNFGKQAASLPAQSSSSSSGDKDVIANNEDGESEEPPKNEFKAVKEDNSVFDVRCKVYGRVGNETKDKGIGQLYIKKVDSSLDQYQMVVRADNNLGTIILNMRLQRGLPFKLDKKQISTVDPNNGNPTMIFIRVKTEDIANELHKQLEEFSR